jgi:hypothetical protein
VVPDQNGDPSTPLEAAAEVIRLNRALVAKTDVHKWAIKDAAEKRSKARNIKIRAFMNSTAPTIAEREAEAANAAADAADEYEVAHALAQVLDNERADIRSQIRAMTSLQTTLREELRALPYGPGS